MSGRKPTKRGTRPPRGSDPPEQLRPPTFHPSHSFQGPTGQEPAGSLPHFHSSDQSTLPGLFTPSTVQGAPRVTFSEPIFFQSGHLPESERGVDSDDSFGIDLEGADFTLPESPPSQHYDHTAEASTSAAPRPRRSRALDPNEIIPLRRLPDGT